MLIRTGSLLALLVVSTNFVFSQLSVQGTLVDAELDEPLGFANVAAYPPGGDTPLAGATSDIDGNFKLTDLEPGTYIIRASFIGYADAEREVTLSQNEPTLDLGTLSLGAGGVQLAEAVVTGERALMELGLDRKVFNVSDNIAATGGSATDLLTNLPSITVDLDGNVSLRGSGNVRFLINGRPSGLTSGDPTTFLQSLSAANIERIEVITNPGAGFDPEGTAGLINIVLKQERTEGFNGSVTANVGTNDKYDGNLSLNYRKGLWNHFASVGGRFDNRAVEGERGQTFSGSGLDTSRIITFGGFRQRTGITTRLGTEFRPNKRGQIGLQGNFQYGEGDSRNDRRFSFLDENDDVYQRQLREEIEPEIEREYEVRADFSQGFAEEGHSLAGAFQYGYSSEQETENYTSTFFDIDDTIIETDRQNAPVDEERNEFLGQLDYERRINVGGFTDVAFTAGWRTTIERLRENSVFNDYDPASDVFTKVDSASNLFEYSEDVHALYATLGADVADWSLSVGLRAEQAYTTSDVLEPVEQAKQFDNDYFELYPSVYVGYELSENLTTQVSYSRRINRPRSRALNPFIDRGDPLNLRSGNPFLLPEIINSFEANVQQRFGKGTLTSGVYYREKSDLISRVTETLPGGVQLSTRDNLASGRDIGVEVITTYRPNEKVDLTVSGNAYRTQIDGELAEGAIDVDGYLFDSRASLNAKLAWGIAAQATYFYRSPGVRPQGEIRAIQFLDIGLRKDILGNRGAVTLRASDVFDTRQYRFTTDVSGLQSTTRYKRESRIVYLGFQYRFGIDADKRQRERDRGSRDGSDGGGDDDM